MTKDQQNPGEWIREAALKHSNATEPVLIKALEDTDVDIRLAAVNNPNATEQVFRQASIDKDERVRKAVAHNTRASTIAKIVGALGR